MKPLLAEKADLDKLKFPLYGSPKLDGIRCVITDGMPRSRKLKNIPNKHIQKVLSSLTINGLDGELMVDGDFNDVQSAVMSEEGEPDFRYNVFDCFEGTDGTDMSKVPFYERAIHAQQIAVSRGMYDGRRVCVPVAQVVLRSKQEVLDYLDKCVAEGYEGCIVRSTDGIYKFGRSTVNEGILLKVKKFYDDEGVLVDILEKMTNTNKLERNEVGEAKRSSAKDGLVPAGTCGSFIISWKGKEFKVGFGPGITDGIKKMWWDNKKSLIGRLVTFSYQELSKDGIPRFGKVKSFRPETDT